jgi:hypothetical protein
MLSSCLNIEILSKILQAEANAAEDGGIAKHGKRSALSTFISISQIFLGGFVNFVFGVTGFFQK